MTFHRAQLLRRHASSLFLKGCLFSERRVTRLEGVSQLGVSVCVPLDSQLFFLWSSFKVLAVGEANKRCKNANVLQANLSDIISC